MNATFSYSPQSHTNPIPMETIEYSFWMLHTDLLKDEQLDAKYLGVNKQ